MNTPSSSQRILCHILTLGLHSQVATDFNDSLGNEQGTPSLHRSSKRSTKSEPARPRRQTFNPISSSTEPARPRRQTFNPISSSSSIFKIKTSLPRSRARSLTFEEKRTSSRSKRISYASSMSYVSTKKPSPNSKPQIRHAFG